ncbi:MAG: hypothetical protein AB7V27_12005 [Candidatus Binatia bacterium]
MTTITHDAEHTHERRDIYLKPVVWAGFALLIILLMTFALMFGLFERLALYEARSSPPANPLAAVEGRRMPPQPRLQAHPLRDLHDLRAAEEETLNSYGWVDKDAGVVRIPIARAIDLLAERAGQKPEATAR